MRGRDISQRQRTKRTSDRESISYLNTWRRASEREKHVYYLGWCISHWIALSRAIKEGEREKYFGRCTIEREEVRLRINNPKIRLARKHRQQCTWIPDNMFNIGFTFFHLFYFRTGCALLCVFCRCHHFCSSICFLNMYSASAYSCVNSALNTHISICHPKWIKNVSCKIPRKIGLNKFFNKFHFSEPSNKGGRTGYFLEMV